MWNLLVQLTPPFETPNAPSRILLFHAYPNEQGWRNRPVESGSVHTERSLFTIHQAISHSPEADLFNTRQENRRAEQINGISCFYSCTHISQEIIFPIFLFQYSLIEKWSASWAAQLRHHTRWGDLFRPGSRWGVSLFSSWLRDSALGFPSSPQQSKNMHGSSAQDCNSRRECVRERRECVLRGTRQ